MKKFLQGIAAVTSSCLLMMLAACGGGGGGSSTASTPTVNCTAPGAKVSPDGKSCITATVAIISVTDAVGTYKGPITNGGATNDTQPVLNGILAQAVTSTQNVYVLKDGALLGMVTPKPAGASWSYQLPVLADNQTHVFTAEVRETGGTVIDKASDPFKLTVVTSTQYTKISNDGRALPASSVLGGNTADWACTLAYNSTTDKYLLWEVKTTDGGLRDWNKAYTNYDDVNAQQMSTGVGTSRNPSQAEIDASTNSVGFKNAVNAAGLCGQKDWGIPTSTELEGIQYGSVGSFDNPIIDTAWFPNTKGSFYWTSTISDATSVIIERFNLLGSRNGGRSGSGVYLRLVRGN